MMVRGGLNYFISGPRAQKGRESLIYTIQNFRLTTIFIVKILSLF